MAQRESVAIATDAGGDFTGYSGVINGKVHSLTYVPDGTSPLDTGADLTVTTEDTAQPVLTAANIGTSTVTWRPRGATHDAADGGATLYAAAGEPVLDYIHAATERIKVVIAQGGDTKLGTLHIVYGG